MLRPSDRSRAAWTTTLEGEASDVSVVVSGRARPAVRIRPRRSYVASTNEDKIQAGEVFSLLLGRVKPPCRHLKIGTVAQGAAQRGFGVAEEIADRATGQ